MLYIFVLAMSAMLYVWLYRVSGFADYADLVFSVVSLEPAEPDEILSMTDVRTTLSGKTQGVVTIDGVAYQVEIPVRELGGQLMEYLYSAAASSVFTSQPEAMMRSSALTPCQWPDGVVILHTSSGVSKLEDFGCGFRATVKIGEERHDVLLTCRHVLTSLGELERLTLRYKGKDLRVPYCESDIRFHHGLDLVAISVPKGVWSVLGVKSLRIGDVREQDILSVYTPTGSGFSRARGLPTKRSQFTFSHSASSLRGSSGSPVMNNRGRVVGIHWGCKVDRTGRRNCATQLGFLNLKSGYDTLESKRDAYATLCLTHRGRIVEAGCNLVSFRGRHIRAGLDEERCVALELYDEPESDSDSEPAEFRDYGEGVIRVGRERSQRGPNRITADTFDSLNTLWGDVPSDSDAYSDDEEESFESSKETRSRGRNIRKSTYEQGHRREAKYSEKRKVNCEPSENATRSARNGDYTPAEVTESATSETTVEDAPADRAACQQHRPSSANVSECVGDTRDFQGGLAASERQTPLEISGNTSGPQGSLALLALVREVVQTQLKDSFSSGKPGADTGERTQKKRKRRRKQRKRNSSSSKTGATSTATTRESSGHSDTKRQHASAAASRPIRNNSV